MTKRYLAQQGVGYFAFAFLFLRSFSTAQAGGPFFDFQRLPNGLPFLSLHLPAGLYFGLGVVCLGLSIAFGIAFFAPILRKPSLQAESLLSLVFSPAALLSFIATWFDNRALLAGIGRPWVDAFVYAFLFWLVFLVVTFAIDLRKLRRKL
ncbi:MAG: hypothetical protein HY681_10485 [Chloroflexi bacterium]|nr:hypothetical protein [Chloroflexota bacterium]